MDSQSMGGLFRRLSYFFCRFKKKYHLCNRKQDGGIAQLARASALQAEGRRFDSDYLHPQPTQRPF